MADLPSMDDILRDSERKERRSDVRLGLILVIGGLAVALGLHVLVSSPSIQLFVLPTGTIGFGLSRLLRRR